MEHFYIVYVVIEIRIKSQFTIDFSFCGDYIFGKFENVHQCIVQRTFRVEHFRGFLFAFSYNNTEIVQRVEARYIIHVRPESHIGF